MTPRLSAEDLRELSVMAWRAGKHDLAERIDAHRRPPHEDVDAVPPYVRLTQDYKS